MCGVVGGFGAGRAGLPGSWEGAAPGGGGQWRVRGQCSVSRERVWIHESLSPTLSLAATATPFTLASGTCRYSPYSEPGGGGGGEMLVELWYSPLLLL